MANKKSILEKILDSLKTFRTEPYIARTAEYLPENQRNMIYDLMNRGI